MHISRLGKKLTHFVNSKGQIRSSESKVLESSHCTSIHKSILVTKRHTTVPRKMSSHTQRSGNMLTFLHVNSTKDILCILVLSEHHSLRIGSHLDAEEIIERAKVLDRKGGRQLLKQPLSSMR
jgi:hypothetical protein